MTDFDVKFSKNGIQVDLVPRKIAENLFLNRAIYAMEKCDDTHNLMYSIPFSLTLSPEEQAKFYVVSQQDGLNVGDEKGLVLGIYANESDAIDCAESQTNSSESLPDFEPPEPEQMGGTPLSEGLARRVPGIGYGTESHSAPSQNSGEDRPRPFKPGSIDVGSDPEKK